jgi:hypothetical protein
MSEAHGQERPVEADVLPPEPDQAPDESVKSARPGGASRRTVWWLASLLLLVIGGVGSSPFWARDVALFLPWSGRSAAPSEDYAALAVRLAAIENRLAQPSPDANAVSSAISALTHRVDQLETTRNVDRQSDSASAAAKAGLQKIEERLNALETRWASRSAGEAAQFEKLRQELAQIGSASADLADRLSAIERRVGANGNAARTDAALLAALLRMREAVEAARPFAAEYDAFVGLAHDHPDLIAAAQPLAGLAQAGVTGNAVLSQRLGKLSGRIVPAVARSTGPDLGTQALAWLHSLVTIRRIDAASQTGQVPAMNVAEAALARGDLSGAVSALQTLSGSESEALQSWLQTARQRLAAEAVLAHLQELLVARLGTPAEAPGGGPTEAPAKSAQPS